MVVGSVHAVEDLGVFAPPDFLVDLVLLLLAEAQLEILVVVVGRRLLQVGVRVVKGVLEAHFIKRTDIFK